MRWFILALAITFIAIFVVSTLPNAEYGAVVLIGPIPIVFASNFAMVLPLLIFTAILLLALMLLAYISTRENFEIEKKVHERLEVQKPEKKFGGIVLIGPIPIIFGDARIAIFASLIAIVLMVLAILFMTRWFV
ncbi:MAG: TIGR00304 family membrane protein [Archaeoglobaceae archaeon]